jgi:hypothetical protein
MMKEIHHGATEARRRELTSMDRMNRMTENGRFGDGCAKMPAGIEEEKRGGRGMENLLWKTRRCGTVIRLNTRGRGGGVWGVVGGRGF